jgi:hypothetical protein
VSYDETVWDNLFGPAVLDPVTTTTTTTTTTIKSVLGGLGGGL